ncbi:MAG: HEAT repeat domain-containing protein, partial [Anaerolineaceae bacterium]|nr:HEAT repeat domain-containing protein [Anaerolineaceae bacterium]
MITKSFIEELKNKDLEALYKLINETKGNKELVFLLGKLGHLPKNFDASIFTRFTKSSNSEVRFWAVKNIGKQSNPKFLDLLTKIATQDIDSFTRREAVSSIGRMRSRKAIPHLITFLHDEDPKVVLQAVRGLLIFKDDKLVVDELMKLKDHPNEMIQAVISKEFQKTIRKVNVLPHPNSLDYLKNVVVNGDVRKILAHVPDEAIHLTFTSPPYYNARDYSIYESYQSYLDFLTEVFKEVHRVTKEGRFLVLNTSPIIIPRMSRAHSSIRYPIPFDIHCRLTELGWDFIDDIVWLKPESSVKNR